MTHNRRWCLGPVESPEELAEKLTNHCWALCTAFYVRASPQYLFLNDSSSENGTIQFAVVKLVGGEYRQIESITFGWTSEHTALRYVRKVLAGEFDSPGQLVALVLDTPATHGHCHLSA